MKAYTLFFALLLLGPSMAVAQKYGHLNFGNLIASLEDTKTADTDLEAYQKQLIAKGEEMAKTWQTKAQTFAQKVQAGELTPRQQQTQQEELEAERDEIIAYEQEVTQKVQAKRQELLSPIVDKAEAAIKAVAQEGGYVMIFDTSTFNAILFAKDSDDVMELVKAKL